MTYGFYKMGRYGLLCAAACCAMAFEAPQIGIQALGSFPTGAMRSDFASGTGYGLGVFAGWEVGAGKVFRVAYDGIWYPNGGRSDAFSALPSSAFTEADRKSRTHAVTAQYLYYPSGDTEGLYFKVGLGAMNYLTKVQSTLTVPPSAPVGVTLLNESGTKLATLAGLGYDFNKNWGVLAQYSFITVNNRTLGAVQTGVSYRF
jgi:opacity protein-like surface antigen